MNRYLTSQVFRQLACLALLLAILVPTIRAAAPSPNTQSISIAPFLKEVRIASPQTSESFTISLTNDSKKAQQINLSALNFGTLDESGGVVFAGDNATGLVKKYGLAKWLHLEQDRVTIAPDQTVKIQATIINDDSLSPGGHYGAIIASVSGETATSGNQVGVTQKLSSLIFATKLGGEKYDLNLKKVTHDGNWLRAPKKVDLRFYNPGNSHVIPRGLVKLIDGKKVISQAVINQESGYILPETYRQFSLELVPIKPLSKKPLNSYKLEVDYRYDGLDKFAVKTFTVRWFNGIFVLSLGLLLIGLLAVFYLWKTKHKAS